ncbi:MAG TPA: hypothetical protein IAA62_01285 [Candidatus Caccopulliclostridium gallistercoris]|uniref:Uncharacterized protein n=1 Tax=Candidatus Caccopulliclostridium gallistercoris TaxID=2840719 RepID=A0A9D1NEV7_9FIRM|nr:hypothetical protein [Candidatus Caccopulliclostridium gallistercoris]
MEEFNEKKLKKAIIKRALGYDADEVVEEYSYDEEGKPKLSKKRVTKKHYAPDISAMKILIERYGNLSREEIELMSDEELRAERNRLIKLLEEEDYG